MLAEVVEDVRRAARDRGLPPRLTHGAAEPELLLEGTVRQPSEDRFLHVVAVREGDRVTEREAPAGCFLVWKEAVLDSRGEVTPIVLVESRELG